MTYTSSDDTQLLEYIRNTIAQYRMFEPDEPVLVAVSGGADSVALLRLLRELGYPVEIAHFDHQTRDDASAEDAAFVEALAGELGLPFHGASQPITEEARAVGASFEEYARSARYEFLYKTAKARGITAIATGHHADDQAETVLMRLIRGTGPEGLTGIPAVRETDGLRIVRPLLKCSQEDLCDWLSTHGFSWREDVTNSDSAYLRNRIRHELLPNLAANYNPQVRKALVQLAELLEEDTAYLSELANQTGVESNQSLNRAIFARLPLPLQRRCFRKFAWTLGVEPDYVTTLAGCDFIANAPTGQCFDLGSDVLLYNGRSNTEYAVVSQEINESVTLPLPGEITALGYHFTTRYVQTKDVGDPRNYCNSTRQIFDADKLSSPLCIRTRTAGDVMIPFGMRGHRKVQDIMVDLGIPAPKRSLIPLVFTGDTLLWIVGYTSSADAAITPQTQRIVEINAVILHL